MEIQDVKKYFGASVRVWRDRLGVSQEELAERAGLHRTYISDVERGARNVSLESIEKLAGALEVSVSMLLSYKSSATVPEKPDSKAVASDRMVEILFVEDCVEDVEITLRALQRANLANHINIMRDGSAALDYLFCTGEYASRSPDARPDIILLDLGLPKIDGLEVLRRVKTDSRTASIPVIVLTSSQQNRDVTASKKLGADAYILKPVDFDNLSKVTSQLSLKWALLKPAPVLGAEIRPELAPRLS